MLRGRETGREGDREGGRQGRERARAREGQRRGGSAASIEANQWVDVVSRRCAPPLLVPPLPALPLAFRRCPSSSSFSFQSHPLTRSSGTIAPKLCKQKHRYFPGAKAAAAARRPSDGGGNGNPLSAAVANAGSSKPRKRESLNDADGANGMKVKRKRKNGKRCVWS